MQAGGLATQSVDILLEDAFLLFGSTRKTLLPHLLGGVHERFKTLPAHGTLGAHKTRPAHHSRASTNVALIILRAVDLAGVHRPKTLGAHRLAPVHKLDVHYSARREPRYSSRRGPKRKSA